MNDKNQNIISHFLKYQAGYALLAYLIASWTLYGADIKSLQVNDVKQDTKIEANDTNTQEIKVQLSAIQTSIANIEVQLNRIYNQ